MINFYLGEEKYVTARIVPKNHNDTIVVTSAEYELTGKNGEMADSGNCDIDGLTLTMLLTPGSAGSYKLKVSARVGAERIIEKSDVNVRE